MTVQRRGEEAGAGSRMIERRYLKEPTRPLLRRGASVSTCKGDPARDREARKWVLGQKRLRREWGWQ